jgi:hypothetical protein
MTQLFVATDLLSVSVGLFSLGNSYKLSHIVCSLLCLDSFTKHTVFKVHVGCNMYQQFSCMAKLCCSCMDIGHAVYPYIHQFDRHLGFHFWLLGVMVV